MASIAVERPLTHRVSWGALFAAFFVGFGIWLVLLALGAGIGLGTFDPRSPQSWQGLGVGFGIWGGIAAIISLFLAGWTAARLSESEVREEGALHGVALWGFMLVASLWMAAMAIGSAVSGAASVAGTAAQTAGQAAASNPQLQGQAQQAGGQLQQQAQQKAQQLQQQAPQAAETAASIGTKGAWGFFITGILTLAAAALGGSAGVGKVRNLRGREERAAVPGRPLEPQRT